MAPAPVPARTAHAALLLALVTILLHPNPSAAQQTDAESQLPAPPLTAQAAGNAVELRWDPVDGAARYELRSWTESGGWHPLGDNLTATTFIHTEITPGVDYYYWVRAFGSDGNPGEWSPRQSATVPAPPTPSPTTTSPPTDTPTAPSPATASPPTDTPTPTAQPPATATAAPTATSTPAPPPTPTPTSDTPPLSLSSSEPSAPALTAAVKDGGVDLSWDTVAGAAYYDLRAYTEAGGWELLGGEDLTGAAYRHAGLTAGTDYYYWVRAVFGPDDFGPWSQRVPATIPLPNAPTPTPTPTATPTATPSQPPPPSATPTSTPTSAPPPAPTATPSPTPTALPQPAVIVAGDQSTPTPTPTPTALPQPAVIIAGDQSAPTPTATPTAPPQPAVIIDEGPSTPTPTATVPLSLASTDPSPPVLVATVRDRGVDLTWTTVDGAAYYDLRPDKRLGPSRRRTPDRYLPSPYRPRRRHRLLLLGARQLGAQ